MNDQWVDWLQEKQRHFFYGVILVVALFFLAFQVYGKFQTSKKGHYFSAHQTVEKWLSQGEAFGKLEKILKTHPDLEAKFGAQIASKFIAENQGVQAASFAENVFERIMRHTPEHTAFAEGSLLIAKGDYRDALSEAVSLKARLSEDSLLYGFNLVRIASLYRTLHLHDQELAALDDLEHYLKTSTQTSEVVSNCFLEGEHTLIDYVAFRKAHVKSTH